MTTIYARRVIPRTDDEIWAGLFDDERLAADRAAYAESRDRLAGEIAPPTCGGGPYYGMDERAVEGELLTAIIGRWWRALRSRGWEEWAGDALGALAYVGVAAFLAWMFWRQVAR